MAKQKKVNEGRTESFHRDFAEKIIAMLEAGTSPWQQGWHSSRGGMPYNPQSGTRYKGVNCINLFLAGYDDPRWMTYRQASEAGYQVRRGERGTPIIFYKFVQEVTRLDDDGKPMLDENGKPEKELLRLSRPIVRLSYVFNAGQIDGIEPLPKEVSYTWEPQERAERILAASGATIKHDAGSAFYRPSTDTIHLPPKDSFEAPNYYYATALHELGHWTGHSSRLDRDCGPFGTERYAREELRAEIASWMIGEEIGVGHNPGNHAAYVQNWIQALREDPSEIFRACRDAEDIRSYIYDLEKEHALEGTAQNSELKESEPKTGADMDSKMMRAPSQAEPEPAKIWLAVPYREKNQAKKLGAQWDRETKRWYVLQTSPEVMDKFAAWLPKEAQSMASSSEVAEKKVWLAVPFDEKEQAKRLGARWDGKAKSWYVPEGTELGKVRRWIPDQAHETERLRAARSVLSPEEEFRDKLTELGLDLRGQLPILDGMPHRVPVIEKNGRGLDGCYCLHGDGRPAGWAQNHVTGVYIKLVATGAHLSPEELARQRATFAARKAEHEQQRKAQHAEAARKAVERFEGGHAVTAHPYLVAKGVPPIGPVREQAGKLLIPIRDAEGNFRGLQSIDDEGRKRFTPGMEKKGGFCLLDDEKQFNGGEIILCEGYATGVSLALATEKPVAVAFDAGNLEAVAEALREKFPRMAITICADNDHATERDGNPWNPGVEKAKAAAQKVNGKVLVPVFSEAEKAQRLTDFNDLHKARGLGAVRGQLSRTKEQDVER